ncbi:MAG: hypothetical protein JNK05_36835 [Myxococcales bacterium]|nr:hypothetical protein [Myxococcales bacterium]
MAKAKTTKVSSKATAKKSAAKPAKATAKPAKPAKPAKKATKASTKSGSGDHSMQLDFGYFEMKQNNSPVGNIVVTPGSSPSIEYYYLCTKASGGYQKYVWPGPGNPVVTTQYIYLGPVPSTFDPNQPEAFGSTLPFYPNVQFIGCDCSVGP